MDKHKYIPILENPKLIQQENITELKSVIDKYPYFQSARVLYLKALKNQESFKYNNELKTTAAYTTNRTVLFDFITSNDFNEVKVSSEEKETEVLIKQQNKVIEVEKDLQIGKPLAFDKSETYSFNQWLQLSSKKIITREVTDKTENNKPKDNQESIIDLFIANNPKMPKVSKTTPTLLHVENQQQSNELMTETLAKVYLEQKKYINAIKAYEILSLKYPEKSGFFADQIKRIRILKNSK